MKKIKVRKLITALLALSTLLVSITGCSAIKNKKETTVKEFTNIMKDLEFDVQDATDQVQLENLDSVTIAINNDYQIELYVFSEESAAKKAYKNLKEYFESDKGSNSAYKSVSLKNYEYYKLTTSDMYDVDYRIGKTVVYVSQDKEYKKDIEKVLKKLGYN